MWADILAHWSAYEWERMRRRLRRVRDNALLVVLLAWWSPSEVEAYREEWARETRGGDL